MGRFMGRRSRTPEFIFVYAVTAALAGIILLPFAVVVLGSVLPTEMLGISSEQWVAGEEGFITFKWYGYVWDLYRDQLLFSLQLALLSVALAVALGVPAGYALARTSFPGRRLLEELILAPLSLPGIAVSVGLIQTYSVIRGRWELILCGHLLYTIPFMVRSVTNTIRSYDLPGLETAARSLGAGFWRRFLWVVLPNLRHAMVLGSLLVFAISLGEFNVSFLLNTPLHQTYPAALFATYTSNSFAVSSAATTLFLLLILPALLAIQWISGREETQPEQGA